MNHELFTRMLFVDAIIGAGFPHEQVITYAELGGLAASRGDGEDKEFIWSRYALEELELSTLQELYTALKLHEVTHAEQN